MSAGKIKLPRHGRSAVATRRLTIQRKADRAALLESEARYRDLVELSPDGIAVHRDGKIVFINTAGARLLGATDPADLIGKPILDLVHPDYRAVVLERLRQMLDERKPGLRIEEQLVRLDGGLVDVEVAAMPLLYQGQPAIQVVVHDITERKRVAEALRRSEERYRSLVENLNDVVFSTDIVGTLTYVSPTIERISGYTAAEITGESFGHFVHPEDLPRVQASFMATLAGQLEPIEFRVVDRDGAERWIRTSSRLLFEQGELVGITGVITDISERKDAEAALQATEARYRNLFENAHDLVYTHDLLGTFQSVNRAAERVSGYSREEALTMNMAQIIAPEHLPYATELMMGAASGEEPPTAIDLDIITKDGRRVPLEVSPRVIYRDGVPVGVQGIARDITERKSAEEARQIEATVSAALVRVGRELIASFDRPALLDRLCQVTAQVLGCDCSHTMLWQPTAEAFVAVSGYGYTPEQWEWLRVIDVPRAQVTRLVAALEHADAVTVLIGDGTDNPLRMAPRHLGFSALLCMALRRGDDLIGIHIAGSRDRQQPFTEAQERMGRGIAQFASMALDNARLVDELARASRLKSDFVATMSHELRTPLNVMMGYTDLLLDGSFGELTAEQMESLQRVDQNARELLHLINATLDVSRLETGRAPLDTQEVQLAAMLEEISQDPPALRPGSEVRFVWNVAPHLPAVWTDPTKLKVVLKNVVGNAAKFTPAGSITVDAHHADDGVEITVADTGIGISAEALPIIFEPFRQADGSSTRRYGGVGLGLYIVRRLLDLLGGTIEVQSQVGHGSTFQIRLPRGQSAVDPP